MTRAIRFLCLAALLAAAGTPVRAQGAPRDPATRAALADEMTQSLRRELLAAWYPRVVDHAHGGFLSGFDYRWQPEGPQDKMIVTQARHVWTTARAALFFPEDPTFLPLAAHGFAFLRDVMWDREHGGFFWLVARDGTPKGEGGARLVKQSYGNAFGIYALAAYYDASGDTAALHLAQDAFAWLDRHAHDPVYGGYFNYTERDGTPLREGFEGTPPKDQNSSIHLLEAFTELYRVWPDPVLRDRLEELLVLIRDTLRVDPGHLTLFASADWTPVSYRDASEAVREANHYFDHVSFGHDVETAYLMLEAAEALGLEDDAATLAAGKQMVDHALRSGWDDAAGGFYDAGYYFAGYYFAGEADLTVVRDTKNWWAQAEGLNTLLLLADRFPDDPMRYADRFAQLWAYIQAHLIDHEHGGWYEGGLDREPERRHGPKAHIWKAAYHDSRALMNVVRRLRAPHGEGPSLRLSRLVGDGMVMQRDAAVPVWGWAAPGDSVTVTFDDAVYRTQAGPDGAWRVTLPPMPAGGPHALTVEAGDARVDVRDVLVGDVWVASGQSNMEWTVAAARDAAQEIAAADDPWIRHFKVPISWAPHPEDSLAGGSWAAAGPSTVGSFSAVGYFFARDLRAHVDVPIGILNTSWGGSRIEPWMSAGALGLEPDEIERFLAGERAYEQRIRDALVARIGELPERDAGLVDGRAVWADPGLDDADWDAIPVPGLWEQAGYDGMDGVGWYRTAFELTEDEARAGARLGLAMIDDSDVTYVNGREVGRTDNAYNRVRVYDVPAAALRAGRNVVAVRVDDTGGGGGIYGDPGLVYVESGGRRQALAGTWRFRVGIAAVRVAGRKNQLPTLLYNKMVHPLLPYPIKGVIWYQGESNANNAEDAVAYRDLFPRMIADWRAAWGVGDFPFLYVQLANFMAPDAEPSAVSHWALLRESQSATLAVPGTAQAVAIDIGEADDIHPRNKQDVGARLALAARRIAYGHDVVHSGPVYRSHEVAGGRVVLSFDHAGGGLVARGGPLKGFAVAGADGRFVWADAAIEGDRVVVWSDRVPEPVAVRYAWGDNPVGVNLYNAEGLPASPFRTDDW